MADATELYRRPKQARGRATCAAIFEATARIVEEEGEEALNTNRIAEKAGVGIGTLYQYFRSKQAILAAMAQAEEAQLRRRAAMLVAKGVDPDRAMIRVYIAAFEGRPRTRRAAIAAILVLRPLETAHKRAEHKLDGRSEVETFVVTRAVSATIRAAVMEQSPHLHTPEFEDALVRLSRALSA